MSSKVRLRSFKHIIRNMHELWDHQFSIQYLKIILLKKHCMKTWSSDSFRYIKRTMYVQVNLKDFRHLVM